MIIIFRISVKNYTEFHLFYWNSFPMKNTPVVPLKSFFLKFWPYSPRGRFFMQQCHISKVSEMPQYLPRETPYLLREMLQLVWGMCISQGEGASLVEDNGIPWRRCDVSLGICGISCERYCGISKILDMWHYSFHGKIKLLKHR